MSFRAQLTQTATVVAPGASADDYGNAVPDWGSGAARHDEPALLQQTAATEVTVDRDMVTSDWLLFLLPTAVITATCRVLVEGRTFEVVGLPAVLRTQRGPHHIEARLVNTDG